MNTFELILHRTHYKNIIKARSPEVTVAADILATSEVRGTVHRDTFI